MKNVKRGQVGKLTPSTSETPRGVILRVSRAATRIGKAVDAWAVDGAVYFKLA